MAPPPDQTFEGERHPTGALLVCKGIQTYWVLGDDGGHPQIKNVGIWALKDRADGDKIFFCIESHTWDVLEEGDTEQTEHRWMSEAEYTSAVYSSYWVDYDMHGNSDFDVDGGLRDRLTGVAKNGTNQLVERDGGLNMVAISANCP